MKSRWTLFALLLTITALAASQAGGRFGARAAAAAVDAGFHAASEAQDKDKHGDKHGRDHKDKSDRDEAEFTERDEFRQSYTLAPGSAVRVSGINGGVDIETAGGNVAEVHVVRSARNKSDLDHHKIVVEQTASGLVVRGEKDKQDSWRDRGDGDRPQVRQRVTMRIPRNVDFTASGINGRATVGEIEGPVRLSGINGRVEVAQARGYTDISGINGSVTMMITGVIERGIRVSGVNGSVALRFGEALNADLSVSGVNGAVNTEGLPNVIMQSRVSRQNFNARIGAGGSPIKVSGVNGSVRLAPRS